MPGIRMDVKIYDVKPDEAPNLGWFIVKGPFLSDISRYLITMLKPPATHQSKGYYRHLKLWSASPWEGTPSLSHFHDRARYIAQKNPSASCAPKCPHSCIQTLLVGWPNIPVFLFIACWNKTWLNSSHFGIPLLLLAGEPRTEPTNVPSPRDD